MSKEEMARKMYGINYDALSAFAKRRVDVEFTRNHPMHDLAEQQRLAMQEQENEKLREANRKLVQDNIDLLEEIDQLKAELYERGSSRNTGQGQERPGGIYPG